MYSLVVSAVSAVMGFSVLVAPVQAREGRTPAVQLASGHLTTEQVVDRVLTNVEPRILRRYYEARGGSAVRRVASRARIAVNMGAKARTKESEKGCRRGLRSAGGTCRLVLPNGGQLSSRASETSSVGSGTSVASAPEILPARNR